MSSLYPQINESNPNSYSNSSSSNMYPSISTKDLAEKLFPDTETQTTTKDFTSSQETILKIPNSIVHLIDKDQSIELASGTFEITCLKQSGNVVAVLARVGDELQWPLAKDEAVVKLDEFHYFFTLRVPDGGDEEVVSYGLTVGEKGGEEMDRVLREYSAFQVKEVEKGVQKVVLQEGGSEEAKAAAYWTTLAPNVEDYSHSVARMIASGSGQLIRGIIWCGDVTVDRLKWGNEFLKMRMKSGQTSEISPATMRRIKRVKKLTKKSEDMATGLLSGVVKVSGFFTSAIVNSIPGKKFFNLLPGEIVLASLDGFNKVCDAVEVAGRNVLATTSTVTTDLVSHKHGEHAAKATSEGMDAAGHAFGTAWAVFKIRKALNPKSVVKPTTLVKAAASKSGSSKSK